MKLLIFTGLLLASFQLFAKGVSVDWSCPKESGKTQVEVSFNEEGKLTFEPDVFNVQFMSVTADVLNGCIKSFQEKVSTSVSSFKQTSCPASKDQICYASLEYTNGKVLEKLKNSSIVKKTSSLSVGSVSTSPVVSSSAQAYLEEKIAKKEINPKNLGQSFVFNDKTYKVSDFDKIVGDNIENVFMNMSKDEARQYAQNYLVTNSGVLNAKEQSQKRTDVLNNLNKMFGYIYAEKGAEELAKILECKPEDNLQPIQDIMSKIEQTAQASQCAELSPGQHKVFSRDNSNYYSTGNYTLKRKQDGNYQAVLNVNFKSGSSKKVAPDEMLARARRCLAQAAPYMKGPDGKLMEMVIVTPDEAKRLPDKERPDVNDISIEGPDHSTVHTRYSENVNCGVITHEMLHLLGLCDEYKEDRAEYAQYDWNCRVVTKAPSLMRDMSVFERAVPQEITCSCSGPVCSNIMGSNNENLKKLFTSESIYDVVDYKFRNNYCSESALGFSKNITNPDKTIVIQSETAQSLVLESRYLLTESSNNSISRTKVTCNCPAGNQDCLNEKKKIVSRVSKLGVRRFCPGDSKPQSTTGTTKSPGVSFGNKVLTLVSSPELPSLLQPSHFNKILEGNCPGKAQGYQQCAEFAYKGKPCNVPAKCNDDKYYLGSQQ